MPKPKPKKNANRIKPELGYKRLQKEIIEAKIISINEDSLQEIDRLERLVNDYETLVSMMEEEWQPKKTANPIFIESIVAIRAMLKRRL